MRSHNPLLDKKIEAAPEPEVIQPAPEPISDEAEFLPDDLVMLDCEMTCVQPKRDELLQVAMLKLKRQGIQYEAVGEPLVLYLHTKTQPTTNFHKKFLSHIFEKCNESELAPEQAKAKIHAWLGDLRGKVMPCGDCVPTDVAFLLEKGLIDAPDIVDDQPVPGTFHYEFWEMNPLKAVSRHKTQRKESLADLDEENIHDALVDDLNQLVEMNHYLQNLLGLPARPTAQVRSGLNVEHHTALMDLYDCCSEKDYNFHWAKEKIPKEAIFAKHPYQTEFKNGLEQHPHVTVLFGIENEADYFPIRKYFSEQEPFKFRMGPIKAFRNEDKPYDVLVCAIESPDLERHHWHIRDNHPTNCSFPDYKPHLTLGYINKNTCRDLEGPHDWQGTEYVCPTVKFSHIDDFKIDMPLKKKIGMQKYVGWGAVGKMEAELPKDSDLARQVREGKHTGHSMGCDVSAHGWGDEARGTGIYSTKPLSNEEVIAREQKALRDKDKLPHIRLKVQAEGETTLPRNLAPAHAPGLLPAHLDAKLIQTRYHAPILRADTFQDFQELLNRVMVENAVLEEFRQGLAGVLNEVRVRAGYPAL